MDFDFHHQFKDYSNIDLLKIVKQPENYQPAAITAASAILGERQITTEDLSAVNQHFLDLEKAEKNKKEKIGELKNKVADLLQPVTQPGEKIEPNKWLNILLLVITIQYAWTLFNTAKQLAGFFNCYSCSLDPAFFLGVFILMYIPVIFFLLFKRKRWGWILLYADNLFALISGIGQTYIFFKYQRFHHGNTAYFLLSILIRAAFVSFLWRDLIANHFGVNHETKKTTALVTTAGSLLFVLIAFVLSEQ